MMYSLSFCETVPLKRTLTPKGQVYCQSYERSHIENIKKLYVSLMVEVIGNASVI